MYFRQSFQTSMLITFDSQLLMLTVLFLSQNVTYLMLCTHDDFSVGLNTTTSTMTTTTTTTQAYTHTQKKSLT